MPATARILAAAAALLLLVSAHTALADEKRVCVQAFEEAQQLRMDGKLRAARERLLTCSNERCPALLRQDCTQWTSEVLAAMPTVVFGARDPAGRDVASARVLVDGAVVAARLDGEPVTLDPGRHVFRFEAAGVPPVEQQALIRAGEKNREITVTMGGTSTPAAPAAPPEAAPSGASPANAPDGGTTSHSMSPLVWIFGGVGVASLGASLGLELSVKSDADRLRATCGPGGCSASQVDPLKTRQAVAGIALGTGIVSLGVATYFFLAHHDAPAASATAGAHLELVPSSRGLEAGLVGRFP